MEGMNLADLGDNRSHLLPVRPELRGVRLLTPDQLRVRSHPLVVLPVLPTPRQNVVRGQSRRRPDDRRRRVPRHRRPLEREAPHVERHQQQHRGQPEPARHHGLPGPVATTDEDLRTALLLGVVADCDGDGDAGGCGPVPERAVHE